MKRVIYILCAMLVMASCHKGESFDVKFKQTGFYFQWGGEPQTHSYTTHHVMAVTLLSVTDGWECSVNGVAHTVTITPPADPGTDEAREKLRSGRAVFNATSNKGDTTKYTIEFYIVSDKEIDLTANGAYANCYVVTEANALYRFDATYAGSGSNKIAPKSVGVLWQTKYGLLKHLSMSDSGEVSFYVDGDKDDDGEYILDEEGHRIVPNANALVVAYNDDDDIIWSWHIWLVEKDNNPLTNYDTYANGKSFMRMNLGAYANSNGETGDTDLILESYGLYYQWGRKDPFARPLRYNCGGGDGERLYGSKNTTVYHVFEETDKDKGTLDYATAHPMAFITNAACVATDKDGNAGDGIGDWLQTSDRTLWSDTEKTVQDPCPYGWRVPAAGDFDVLMLADAEDATELDTARQRYGWKLTDGTADFFYTAAGLRPYYTGRCVNMNYNNNVYPSTPEPWEGYYWTTGSTADGKQSTCMYFDLTTTRTINKFQLNYVSRRANAMQVRCVKM